MRLMSIRRFTLKTIALLSFGVVSMVAAAQQGGNTVLLNTIKTKAASNAASGISTSVVLTVTTPGTIYFGQSVDGDAQVSSIDGSAMTGTISFYDGAANFCVIPVATGASCPASSGVGFAAGTHVLTAVYSGDTGHSGSTSNVSRST